MSLSLEDLDGDTLRKLGVTRPRQKKFTAENERQFAIKALNLLSTLTQSERARVLRRATTLNNV